MKIDRMQVSEYKKINRSNEIVSRVNDLTSYKIAYIYLFKKHANRDLSFK